MTTLEKIRAEIAQLQDEWFKETDGWWCYEKALQILDKYAEQEPKTGHWIYTEYHTWCCSECGGNPHKGTGFVPNKDGMKMRWKYCNLCGAKMVEPQESEESE